MQKQHKAFRDKPGQVAMITVIFFIFISLSILFGLVSIAMREIRNAEAHIRAEQSFYTAEGGVEDVLYRIKNNLTVDSSESYILGMSQATVLTTDVAGTKMIIGSGDASDAIRKIRVQLKQGISGVGFVYALQVGAGGLSMSNNAVIQGSGGAVGNVYSNGPIAGAQGAVITGDATVAGSSGSLGNVRVKGTARAHTITASDICGDGYYASIDASSLAFLNSPASGTCSTPLSPGTAYPGSADASPASFPITDAQIQQWKNEAASGGTITGNCGVGGTSECVIANNDSLYLGPKKIVGNLLLSQNQTLILTGTLYFTGSVTLSNPGVTLQCAPTFGAQSCMLISDGFISVANNASFQGSGASGSYIMLLSTVQGCNGGTQTSSCAAHNSGLDLSNNAEGTLFYVPYSLAYLNNNSTITSLTAFTVHMNNNAIINYTHGLATSTEFSSGPTGGWVIQSWEEVE